MEEQTPRESEGGPLKNKGKKKMDMEKKIKVLAHMKTKKNVPFKYGKWESSLNYVFIHQIFIEDLLCVRHLLCIRLKHLIPNFPNESTV